MGKRKLSEKELQTKRDKYKEDMLHPEKRKAIQQQKREYHQKRYADIKADPVLWANHLEKQTKWRKENTELTARATIRYRLRSPERWLWNQARKRALVKKFEFTIKLEDVVIPECCPIMCVKLEYIPGGYYDYSPSIDRIDSTKGYTKDNIQIISSIANRMKWDATKEQLLTFCKGVLALEKESQATC